MAIRSLATLLILVSIAALALAKTKCLEMPVQEIEIGKVTASIRGGTLDLVLNTVAGVEIPGIHWAVDSLVERQRTRILDELGNRVPQCVAPRVNPYDWLQDIGNPHYLNPVEPPSASACTGWNTGSGAAEAIPTCGEILGAYTVSEMECESSHLTTRLGGVDFELVRINMTLPGVDNFLLAVTYFIAGEDANFDFSGITNYSRAVTYLADKVKVSYEIIHYPFEDTSAVSNESYYGRKFVNESFLSIYMNFTTGLPDSSDVTLAFAQTPLYWQIDYNATVKGGTVRASNKIDSLFYMDDHLVVNAGTPIPLIPLQLPGGLPPLRVNIAITLCADNKSHWDQWYYDPSFGAFFSPVNPPTSGPAKKSNQALIIGLTVSLIVLVVLIVVAIILVTKVERLKFLVRPFTQRKARAKNRSDNNLEMMGQGPKKEPKAQSAPNSNHNTVENGNGWMHSSRPKS